MNKDIMQKVANINVELKSEKVELGLVENIQKASDSSKKLEDSIRAASKDVDTQSKIKAELEKEYAKATKAEEKAQEKFFKEEKKVDSVLTKIDELLDKTNRAARELGVNPSKIDGYKELEQNRKNLSKARVGK